VGIGITHLSFGGGPGQTVVRWQSHLGRSGMLGFRAARTEFSAEVRSRVPVFFNRASYASDNGARP
jgi:hypothetical protein